MPFIKMVCNFCNSSAEGFKGDLEMLGWSSTEVRVKGSFVKKTACPAHKELVRKN